MSDSLIIGSPKQKRGSLSKKKEFFPYYAGFPESFASGIISTANLQSNAVVADPWNGSGTTTYVASRLGYDSYGIDLNPVMVLVAKARMLPPSEADSIEPQAKSLVHNIARLTRKTLPSDPLLQWFTDDTASIIRNLEHRIRTRLISDGCCQKQPPFDKISGFAATFYVALFTICRNFTKRFRPSNPTWLRAPRASELRISLSAIEVASAFTRQAQSMADSLQDLVPIKSDGVRSNIVVGNTTQFQKREFADLVLTSPPYCTRLDYTAATRIELAVISPSLGTTTDILSQQMIGSIKVPSELITPNEIWGNACSEFIKKLTAHRSKASQSYYKKTHLDYFNKMSKSITNISSFLKDNGIAIFVIQDSYYKDIHNNLPLIISEMAENSGLKLFRREDFIQTNTIAGINSKSKQYRKTSRAIESVICFRKSMHKEMP